MLLHFPFLQKLSEILNEILADDNDSQIAFREGKRHVARLIAEAPQRAEGGALPVRAHGAYLITGGVGSLGIKVATWMASQGARHLVLTARNFPARADWPNVTDTKIGRVIAEIGAIESSGATVEIHQADVSDEAPMAAILAQLPYPLRGVIHAAGVSSVEALQSLDAESFNAVLKPKVAGGWVLHQLTKTLELDFFVLFSSIASVWGSKGLAHYATANHFLDALAHYRRSLNLPALSINWGRWDNIDLAGEFADAASNLFAQIGIEALPTPEAINALGYLIGLERVSAQKIVCPVDWQRFKPLFETYKRGLPLIAELGDERADAPPAARSRGLEIVMSAPASNRAALLQSQVHDLVAATLRVPPSSVMAAQPLVELGIDSLMAVELKQKFEKEFGVTLPVKIFFLKASVASLTDELYTRLESLTATPIAEICADNEISSATSPSRPVKNSYSDDGWLVLANSGTHTDMRLFCFPYAGGSPAIFREWPNRLPQNVEVCSIHLPARGTRIAEPPITDMEELLSRLTAALLPYLDKPFAFFGHCFGTIVMFELTRRLRSQYGLSPWHLFASGAAAPHLYLVPDFYKFPEERFLEILNFIDFTGTELLSTDESLRQMVMPALNGDFQIAAQYRYTPGAPLDLPITAFAAWEDMFAPPSVVSGWRSYTSGRFYQTNYPGGHYFLETEAASILETVAHTVRERSDASAAAPDTPSPRRSNNDDERLQLFCFPYAGGSAAQYRQWQQWLPDGIELCPIELPGRGDRSSQHPLTEVYALAEMVSSSLEDHLDRPFACFGHDLGAIIMFEVTRQLRRRGLPLPLHLFVSAAVAPQLYYFAPIHLLPQARLVSAIKLFGYPHLEAERLSQFLLLVRSDFAAIANYRYIDEEPLSMPITTIFAEADALIPSNGIAAWREQTAAACINTVINGGHYYLNDQAGQQTVTGIIKESLLMDRVSL